MAWDNVDRRKMISDRRHQTWWEGNNTKLWRLLLIFYLSILSFFSSWAFNCITNAPKIYATKIEVEKVLTKVEAGFHRLGTKIDDNFKFYIKEGRHNNAE